ncbi:MAG TPA: helix-turn-helix domain-containing protein [Acidimicrobiales bacterium]
MLTALPRLVVLPGDALDTPLVQVVADEVVKDEVGQAPMSYLTDWRLTLAADLLREPDATVAGVAHHVGYASAFALSAAFEPVRGVSPRDHRARVVGARPSRRVTATPAGS